jgi:hypothetical protein
MSPMKRKVENESQTIHQLVIKPFIFGVVSIALGGLVCIIACFAMLHDQQTAITVASFITIACGGFIGQILTLTRLTQVDMKLNGRWGESMDKEHEVGRKEGLQQGRDEQRDGD